MATDSDLDLNTASSLDTFQAAGVGTSPTFDHGIPGYRLRCQGFNFPFDDPLVIRRRDIWQCSHISNYLANTRLLAGVDALPVPADGYHRCTLWNDPPSSLKLISFCGATASAAAPWNTSWWSPLSNDAWDEYCKPSDRSSRPVSTFGEWVLLLVSTIFFWLGVHVVCVPLVTLFRRKTRPWWHGPSPFDQLTFYEECGFVWSPSPVEAYAVTDSSTVTSAPQPAKQRPADVNDGFLESRGFRRPVSSSTELGFGGFITADVKGLMGLGARLIASAKPEACCRPKSSVVVRDKAVSLGKGDSATSESVTELVRASEVEKGQAMTEYWTPAQAAQEKHALCRWTPRSVLRLLAVESVNPQVKHISNLAFSVNLALGIVTAIMLFAEKFNSFLRESPSASDALMPGVGYFRNFLSDNLMVPDEIEGHLFDSFKWREFILSVFIAAALAVFGAGNVDRGTGWRSRLWQLLLTLLASGLWIWYEVWINDQISAAVIALRNYVYSQIAQYLIALGETASEAASDAAGAVDALGADDKLDNLIFRLLSYTAYALYAIIIPTPFLYLAWRWLRLECWPRWFPNGRPLQLYSQELGRRCMAAADYVPFRTAMAGTSGAIVEFLGFYNNPLPPSLLAARYVSLLCSLIVAVLLWKAVDVYSSAAQAALEEFVFTYRTVEADLREWLSFLPTDAVSRNIDKVLPLIHGLVEAFSFLTTGFQVGGWLSVVLTIRGQFDLSQAYSRLYQRVEREGAGCVVYRVNKGSALRVASLFGAWALFGTVGLSALFGVIFAVGYLTTTNLAAALFLRRLIQSVLYGLIYDKLFISSVLIPLVLHLDSGWLKLAVAVYYFLIGVIKGVARVGMQVLIMVYYFFLPHIALLPAGFESLDAAHSSFVGAVMAAVELNGMRKRSDDPTHPRRASVEVRSLVDVQLAGQL